MSMPLATLIVTSALTGPSLMFVTVPGMLLRALIFMESLNVECVRITVRADR